MTVTLGGGAGAAGGVAFTGVLDRLDRTERGVLDSKLRSLLREHNPVTACRQADHFEALGILPHDVKRLHAD